MDTALKKVCSLLLLVALPHLVQAQFTYTVTNGTATITGYYGPGGAIAIPATTNGYPVTSIGMGAFTCRTTLTSISIPDSITNIGDSAFYYCSSLTAFTVDAHNPIYSAVEGVLFNTSTAKLLKYPMAKAGSYTVPNSVTSIGTSAFASCSGLTSVMVSDSVTNLEQCAFEYCPSLTNVVLGNGLSSIGSSAFCSCYNLASVTFGERVKSIDYSAFANCNSLVSLVIPGSVLTIGNSAFSSCLRLTEVTMGNGLTSIGPFAFSHCPSLNKVTLPASVTNIEFQAFCYCTNLTSFTLPPGVLSLPDEGWVGCSSLTNITLPSSVSSLGWYTFGSCSSLANVYFMGNAPAGVYGAFGGSPNARICILPGASGWDVLSAASGIPTFPWNLPHLVLLGASPSLRGNTNPFGFIITTAIDMPVVIEACTNLSHPTWWPVGTNLLTGGASYFSDAQWTNCPVRLYRVRSL